MVCAKETFHHRVTATDIIITSVDRGGSPTQAEIMNAGVNKLAPEGGCIASSGQNAAAASVRGGAVVPTPSSQRRAPLSATAAPSNGGGSVQLSEAVRGAATREETFRRLPVGERGADTVVAGAAMGLDGVSVQAAVLHARASAATDPDLLSSRQYVLALAQKLDAELGSRAVDQELSTTAMSSAAAARALPARPAGVANRGGIGAGAAATASAPGGDSHQKGRPYHHHFGGAADGGALRTVAAPGDHGMAAQRRGRLGVYAAVTAGLLVALLAARSCPSAEATHLTMPATSFEKSLSKRVAMTIDGALAQLRATPNNNISGASPAAAAVTGQAPTQPLVRSAADGAALSAPAAAQRRWRGRHKRHHKRPTSFILHPMRKR